MKKIIVFFAVISSFVFVGCTSSTYITSEPDSANVYINNVLIGKTPIVYSDTKIALSCVPVTVEKKGYKKLNTVICKDESVNVGSAIGGFFFWPAWFWVMGYSPMYHFVLESDSTSISQETNLPYTVNDQPAAKTSKAQKLLDLKKVYDEGIITKEEYEKQKQIILETEEW